MHLTHRHLALTARQASCAHQSPQHCHMQASAPGHFWSIISQTPGDVTYLHCIQCVSAVCVQSGKYGNANPLKDINKGHTWSQPFIVLLLSRLFDASAPFERPCVLTEVTRASRSS